MAMKKIIITLTENEFLAVSEMSQGNVAAYVEQLAKEAIESIYGPTEDGIEQFQEDPRDWE